ncbi:hypothetical protein [Thermoactinomyces mirandus]|uniref:Bacterial EndoU nuclease domain-containing protein n=1 Tax=Thermoactinomyces mirandus TaxID=2756294 RepID=A0A7W1XVC4_9BACL|nr:hypothetical protein [Thermoactinomyces mirandus]MBA4603752.1 hypothetical protein [Thermoactinomyces mirandus]
MKEGKINWKNALIAGGLGLVMVFGGEYAGVKFFKNCVAYGQPANSYLAVMLPKPDCLCSPDRGGKCGSGNNIANQIKYVALSKSDIKHFRKHIVSNFSKQAPYLPDHILKAKLDKTSFFNPNWSEEKIITEVEKGYNEALQKEITGEYIYTTGGEQITIYIHPDSKFATAYGSHKLTPSYFGR